MKKNFNIIKYILSFLACLLINQLYAESPKFVQKVEWSSSRNAANYKVEIKSTDSGNENLVFTTTKTFVEFSLPAGSYKYRVSVYDYLGRVSNISSWCDFEILKAVQPEVKHVEETVYIEENDNENLKIPVNIDSVTSESKVELINIDSGEVVEGELNIENNIGESYGQASVAEFPLIESGNWKLKITNPGGLFTESSVLKIDTKAKEENENQIESNEEITQESEEVVEEVTEPEETETEEEEIEESEEVVEEITEPKETGTEEEEVEEPEEVVEEVTEPKETETEEEEVEESEEVVEEVTEPKETETEEEEIEESEEGVEVVTEPEETETEEEEVEESEEVVEETTEPEEADTEEEKVEESEEGVREKKKYKPAGLNLKVGAGCSFPVGEIRDYIMTPYLPSYNIALSLVPEINSKLRFGGELKTSAFGNTVENEFFNYTIVNINSNFNFIVDYELRKDKLYVEGKLGGGVNLLYLNTENPRSDKNMFGYLDATATSAIIWYPFGLFRLEAGFEVDVGFIPDIISTIITPYVSVGVRF